MQGRRDLRSDSRRFDFLDVLRQLDAAAEGPGLFGGPQGLLEGAFFEPEFGAPLVGVGKFGDGSWFLLFEHLDGSLDVLTRLLEAGDDGGILEQGCQLGTDELRDLSNLTPDLMQPCGRAVE